MRQNYETEEYLYIYSVLRIYLDRRQCTMIPTAYVDKGHDDERPKHRRLNKGGHTTETLTHTRLPSIIFAKSPPLAVTFLASLSLTMAASATAGGCGVTMAFNCGSRNGQREAPPPCRLRTEFNKLESGRLTQINGLTAHTLDVRLDTHHKIYNTLHGTQKEGARPLNKN